MIRLKPSLKLTRKKIKCWFDKKFVGEKEFQVGDLVLKWDKPHEDKGKQFEISTAFAWSLLIKEKIGQGTF